MVNKNNNQVVIPDGIVMPPTRSDTHIYLNEDGDAIGTHNPKATAYYGVLLELY